MRTLSLALLLACSPKQDSATPTEPAPPVSWDIPPPARCEDVDPTTLPADSRTTTVALVPPSIDSRAHQVWLLEVEAPVDVHAIVLIDDGAGHRRTLHPRGSGTQFRAPLIGFRQDRQYQVEVHLVADDAAEAVGPTHHFTLEVPALPAPLPDLTLTALDDDRRQDVLFAAQSWPNAFWLVRADADGEIVWALKQAGLSLDVREREDGRLMFDHDGAIELTDWADEAPLKLVAPAPYRRFHHEIIERPGGGFFALADQVRQTDNLPIGYAEACAPGGPATVLDTVVVEIDENLDVVQDWSMLDRLDGHRIGADALELDNGVPDWAHGNALVYLPDDDAFLVSLRSQDAVLRLSRTTGQIEWILANPSNWRDDLEALRLQPSDADFRWPYHQHAPEPLGDQILLFDNANGQNSPCGDPSGYPIRSRVVELRVDAATQTVTKLWSWDTGLFAPVMGDADRTGSGRVLVTYGQLWTDEAGRLADQGYGERSARIFELDPETGTIPWELRIRSDGAARPSGWSAPRAERVGCP